MGDNNCTPLLIAFTSPTFDLVFNRDAPSLIRILHLRRQIVTILRSKTS